MHFPRFFTAAAIMAVITASPAHAQGQSSLEEAYHMALGCAGILLSAQRSPAKAEKAARILANKMGQSPAKTENEIWQVTLIYGALRREQPVEFNKTLQGCLRLGFAD